VTSDTPEPQQTPPPSKPLPFLTPHHKPTLLLALLCAGCAAPAPVAPPPPPEHSPPPAAVPTDNLPSDSTIEHSVKALVSEQLGVKFEEVTDDASLVKDLGADSLDSVELILALEEEFNIEIPDEYCEKLVTVGDATAYIKARVHQMRATPGS
jgi:acyl carrier protein